MGGVGRSSVPGRSPGKGWILPCDTAKGFSAAAICDRLLSDMNAPAGGGAGERLGRIRSQQLTQPPNPHQPNSTPIQRTFPECFLCARAKELLGAADFQAFGRKKTAEIGKDAHTSPSLLYFLPSVCLALQILTPSQLGIGFPSGFWKPSSLLSSLSLQGIVHTAIPSRQGVLFFLPLQEIFQLWSCYKNHVFQVSLGINTRF